MGALYTHTNIYKKEFYFLCQKKTCITAPQEAKQQAQAEREILVFIQI